MMYVRQASILLRLARPSNELTPEMIEAGCRELSRYRYDKSNDEEIVRAIFVAMGGFR